MTTYFQSGRHSACFPDKEPIAFLVPEWTAQEKAPKLKEYRVLYVRVQVLLAVDTPTLRHLSDLSALDGTEAISFKAIGGQNSLCG
jgi:hypothetical protein